MNLPEFERRWTGDVVECPECEAEAFEAVEEAAYRDGKLEYVVEGRFCHNCQWTEGQ